MLGSWPPLRGLSSYCLEIASALARRVNVEFISFKKIYPAFLYPGGGLKDDDSFPSPGAKGLRIRRRLTWYNPLTWMAEAVFVKADLLHAQWWSLPLAAIYGCLCSIFKLRGRPVVFTVHNVLSHDGSRVYQLVSNLLFKMSDHFIVHTDVNRRQLISRYGISGGDISVIPHGSLDFQVRQDVDRMAVRADLGIAAHKKVILLFGTIRPYKGVDTAIKAFGTVIDAIPDAVLLIAGKTWQSWKPYQLLIDRLGIGEAVETCLDYVQSGDVYKYFESADLVVLPYERFDSQSGVGSTAVSFRKPMIVTDVGGLPDLVPDRRWIVPPGSPDDLAHAIIACLANDNLLSKMAGDSESVATGLNWHDIADRTMAIYEKLITGRDNPRMVFDPESGC
jgi:glycosyltransferase involved in cell wall biosynthesis